MQYTLLLKVRKTPDCLNKRFIGLLRMGAQVLVQRCTIYEFHQNVASEFVRIKIVVKDSDHMLMMNFVEKLDLPHESGE
jgi:hypothetical protein